VVLYSIKDNSYMQKTEEFIVKAQSIHQHKYDYTNVTYVTAKSKVIIICPEHGEFTKTPNKHLSGQGCPDCSIQNYKELKTKKFEDFVKEADALHGSKYSYIESTYSNAKNLTTAICPIHGSFEITPDKHLHRGVGCHECSKENRLYYNLKTTEDFITQATTVHHGKYTYDSVAYKKSMENILITCPVHGNFLQTPANHLSGKGCKKCTAGGGFDSTKAAILYYLSIDNGIYYKIGITNRSVLERYSKDEHNRIKIIKEWSFPVGKDALIKEQEILKTHSNSKVPSGSAILRDGNTELFVEDVLGLDYVTVNKD